jgi:hypothetical protein
MTFRVHDPRRLGNRQPCLKVAVEIPDGNDALRPLRPLGLGCGSHDRERRRKRQRGDADNPLEAGRCSALRHGFTVALTPAIGNAVNLPVYERLFIKLAVCRVSLEVLSRIHDICTSERALRPRNEEIRWPTGKTRKRPA